MGSGRQGGPPPAPFLFEPAGDLLRRPAVLEPPDHVLTQGGIGGELPTPLPASPRQVLGVQGEVAAEAAVAVAEAVAAQLAVDGRGMPAEPPGDLADRGAGLDQAEQGATLVEVELAVGPGQRRLRGANPCKGWGFALRDRTHLVCLSERAQGLSGNGSVRPLPLGRRDGSSGPAASLLHGCGRSPGLTNRPAKTGYSTGDIRR